MDEPAPRHRLIEGVAQRRDRHRSRNVIVRGLTVAAGATVLLAGVAMLVLPGPALAVIPVGLAILALEFAWAERMLERAIEQAQKASEAAKQASRAEKVVSAIGAALTLGALVAWGVFGDVPLLPF